MNADLTPTLYLSIEDASRELDSKILIAAAAVQRGLTVVIGQQWLLLNNHAAIPRGLMMIKGMNARQANAMRHVAASGHLTAATDEEALGLADQSYIARDIDPDIATCCDLFLAQGEVHARTIADRTGASRETIRVTGNARIDLLRAPFRALYQAEAAGLRAEHGDYVLLNTNIGAVNSSFGGVDRYRDVVIRIGWMDPEKPEDNALFQAIVDYDEANMALSRTVVAKLSAAYPDVRVIVRPHGSERLETWQRYCAGFPNAHAIRDGRHASWILGARTVIHTCCTTGLEAEILGRAAINLRPAGHKSLLHRVFIANIANVNAENVEDVIDLAGPILNGDTRATDAAHDDRIRALAPHIEALSGDFAHQRIADASVALLRSRGATLERFRWAPTDPGRYLGAVVRSEYQREKISLSLAAFTKAWDDLTRFSETRAQADLEQIGDSLFLITPR